MAPTFPCFQHLYTTTGWDQNKKKIFASFPYASIFTCSFRFLSLLLFRSSNTFCHLSSLVQVMWSLIFSPHTKPQENSLLLLSSPISQSTFPGSEDFISWAFSSSPSPFLFLFFIAISLSLLSPSFFTLTSGISVPPCVEANSRHKKKRLNRHWFWERGRRVISVLRKDKSAAITLFIFKCSVSVMNIRPSHASKLYNTSPRQRLSSRQLSQWQTLWFSVTKSPQPPLREDSLAP